jgi:hypothetical protein
MAGIRRDTAASAYLQGLELGRRLGEADGIDFSAQTALDWCNTHAVGKNDLMRELADELADLATERIHAIHMGDANG